MKDIFSVKHIRPVLAQLVEGSSKILVFEVEAGGHVALNLDKFSILWVDPKPCASSTTR